MKMEENTIRLLRAEEIECRVGTINENGISLLLYKDARVDMRILDETFGSLNWKRKHKMIGESLYCIISVWDEKKQQWISKMDVGTESYSEKEKGQASDSFKRACVSLGIGRELYTAPFIWISASRVKLQKRENRFFVQDKFKVQEITYNDKREIVGLTICNQEGNVLYTLKEKKVSTRSRKTKEQPKDRKADRAKAIQEELVRTGVALDAVLKRYGVASIDEMSEDVYKNAVNSLRKTKGKVA